MTITPKIKEVLNRIFIGQVKDLNSFRKHIAKVLYTLSIGSLLFTIIIFSITYALFVAKEKTTVVELINNANSILQSNLSEQVSIIANNQDFVSYLRSGIVSRQDNYSEIAWLFSSLDSKLISGVSIVDKSGNAIFESGHPTNFSSTVALCYMGNRINSIYGICNYQMTLYFDQKNYPARLNKINHNIEPCTDKECKIYDLSPNEKMGSFPVIATNTPKILLHYNESPSYQWLILISVFILLVLVMTLVSLKIVRRIVDKHLANPIHEIQKSIKIGNRPNGNEREYLTELSYLLKTLNTYQDQQLDIELSKRAAQVAHDIRSPVAALNICLKMLPQVPEEQRILMRNAANRINDIANNLLLQHKGKGSNSSDALNTWLLSPIVETLISEKRVTFGDKNLSIESEISQQGFFTFAEFNPTEMKRLLSNLINNSVEAMSGHQQGFIKLSLDIIHEKIHLAVSDNGSGISPEVQEKILANTLESTKEKGNGLGLSHAKKTIEALGGSIRLISSLGHGTQVLMTLPSVKPPSWLISNIEVSPSTPIAILDDDPSVHGAWDNRLDEVSKNLEIHHFYNSSDFLTWYEKQSQSKIQIFSDYELLGDSLTGLDVLEKLELSQPPVLVTSHYENQEIIERCEKNRIKLLPKNLLAHVLIQVV